MENIITDEEFIKICLESKTMAEACRKLNLPGTTFKRRAISLNVYKPNQGSKGCKKKARSKITIDDLNNDKFSNYQTFKLKQWLLKNNLKENKCEICGISEWNNKPLNCQLHHIDGNKHNNKLENLQILCPNCHSQTETFTAKNYKKYK